MLTISQMRKSIDDLMQNIGSLRAHAVQENRPLTDTEEGLVNESLTRIEELERSLKTELRLENVAARVSKPANQEIKPDPESIPAGSIQVSERKQDRFLSLGEQLAAVVRHYTDRGTDPRLVTDSRAINGMSVKTPSDGGFLVSPEFSNVLLEKVYSMGQLSSRCWRLPISGRSLSIPYVVESSRADGSRWGGMRAYWEDEGYDLSGIATKPKFGEMTLSPHKLIGFAYATDDLLDDAPALEAYITAGFTREFDFKIHKGLISGTGSGQPLGILNAPCLVSVGAETGQTATTLIYENVVNMWSRMYGPCRSNAVWLINQDVEPQLFTMSMAVGTGGSPVYLPPGGASSSPYGSLYGRPVIPMEQCSTLGTIGDIVLADFSQYILGEKGGMRSDSSIHVKFETDQTAFRFIIKLDGQPSWASTLTPFSGSTNTLSPFVALATRS